MCMDVSLACMYVYQVCAWCRRESSERAVMDGSELPCGCWEVKPWSSMRATNALNHRTIASVPAAFPFILVGQSNYHNPLSTFNC